VYTMAMNTYMVGVVLQVEVQAFNEQDALEAVNDCFGQGEACGLNVTEFEVTDYAPV
jgi:hypothetical protein